jgi:hypothetical protein
MKNRAVWVNGKAAFPKAGAHTSINDGRQEPASRGPLAIGKSLNWPGQWRQVFNKKKIIRATADMGRNMEVVGFPPAAIHN